MVPNQRGFIALPMMGWVAIAAGVVILGLGIAVKVQTARLDSVKAEYAGFVAQVEAQGKAAAKVAQAQIAADKLKKERADREHANTKRNLADIYDAYRRLRDSRAAGGIVPPAASGSPSPERACFNRPALDNAVSALDRGTTKILERGDAAIADLNTAKEWAK